MANMPLKGEVIQACKKLKFIDVAFTGVDHIGMEEARSRDIAVSMLRVMQHRPLQSFASAL